MSESRLPSFAESDETGFSEWLRAQSEPAWTDATTHAFTHELGDGSLDSECYADYLVQDYAFVESLVSLVGYGAGQAPTMAQKRRLVEFLNTVTDDEDDYFERSFEALGVAPTAYENPPLTEPTAALCDVVGRAATTGGYAETLAVLLPVEWVYLTWAESVDTPDDPFSYREWVTLHDNPGFASFVSWLRDEMDTLGPTLSPRRQRRVASLFVRAVHLEVAFFDAAYRPE
ncbi:thiaminase (transcriptional activator TenA) [Halogranum rubrum]|uniref:Thiaminase (Transcriptional activator TenA) n=1 Tax=Halogranum rubrum TaxID=553466 RepID=A0A1I4I7Q9_9EURY|nr:TenA family protein [Halogranum rubrum]SFL49811.1 thiaminase (transcriptional activator TenA) [Halogranum rubrum]